MFIETVRWSGQALAILWGTIVFVLTALLSPVYIALLRGRSPTPFLISGIVVTLILAAVTIAFTSLRIAIDANTLSLKFGPFGEKILLDQIVACGRTHSLWTEWGGWGIRYGRRGRMYNVPFDSGEVVQIQLHDGQNIFFSSRQPVDICRELRKRGPDIREL